jgi:hypothetical protein
MTIKQTRSGGVVIIGCLFILPPLSCLSKIDTHVDVLEYFDFPKSRNVLDIINQSILLSQ